jgi:acetyl esterase/lipase
MSLFLLLRPAAWLLAGGLFLLGARYAPARASHRHKNLGYVPATAPDFDTERHRLDVYSPSKKPSGAGYAVVLYIHGGSWDSGSKNLYFFIGRKLARQGVVAVLVNYRLAPQFQVPQMADDCARALTWTTQHIQEYGGDPARVYVMGHSAGGGLAALLATDDALLARHGLPRNPVRGAILNDAAGLDMFHFLSSRDPGDLQYLDAFGRDPAGWKAVSAIYKVRPGLPPFLIFQGERTYPSISVSNARFRKRMAETGQTPKFLLLPKKKHVAMVTQLFHKHNVEYRELLPFVGVGK